MSVDSKKWLLLIHQIPPQPNALRVKIWRRLQQVGAVAIKQSVYVMPLSGQSREDLSWTLREIVEGGGDGSISEACFVEGLSDEQIVRLFRNARRSDYEKLIQEINNLFGDQYSGQSDPKAPSSKGPLQLSRFQRRLDDIKMIDFFHSPERTTAENLLTDLKNHLFRQSPPENFRRMVFGNWSGKTWVTRQNIFVDRIACGWLIRRFVDSSAVFKFVPEPQYTPEPDEIQFDMYDGEFTHEGDQCTFEIMIQRLQLTDHALGPLAEVTHDIDLKDRKFAHSETDGFCALLTGLVAAHPDDDRRMTEGYRLFENLYTYFERLTQK